MNTFNFINVIKMPNIKVNLKRFLQLLSPEEQISEINNMINVFEKFRCNSINIKKNISNIKWTKDIKKRNNY